MKYKFDGTIKRFKARLVDLGNKQVDNIDCKESLNQLKMEMVWLFLDFATKRAGMSFKWMYVMHSCMEISLKMYIWNYCQVWTPLTQQRCVTSANDCMGFDKHRDAGSQSWLLLYMLTGLRSAILTTHCSQMLKVRSITNSYLCRWFHFY